MRKIITTISKSGNFRRRYMLIWCHLSSGPPTNIPSSLPFLLFPLPFSSLPLEVGPLLLLVGPGDRFRVRAEPGRQTVFGEFPAENLAFSSNDLQELCGKWNIKLWGTAYILTN